MYQFDVEHDAIESARTLAASTACPVLVMLNRFQRRYTVGLRTLPGVRQCGEHIATVHRSGLVERECLKKRWVRFGDGLCLCE